MVTCEDVTYVIVVDSCIRCKILNSAAGSSGEIWAYWLRLIGLGLELELGSRLPISSDKVADLRKLVTEVRYTGLDVKSVAIMISIMFPKDN